MYNTLKRDEIYREKEEIHMKQYDDCYESHLACVSFSSSPSSTTNNYKEAGGGGKIQVLI
jgi:hypothetical protein